MAIIRVNKTKDYTIMSNAHFREKEMSLKAKGLLSLMLSLPETWDYSIAGLVAICAEKESAIVSTLKELKKFGYLQVYKLMPNETKSGRIEYVYYVYEKPTFEKVSKNELLSEEKQGNEEQGQEKQDLENQGVEFQGVENQGQLNIYKSNTNKLNTKEEIMYDSKRNRFTPPTLEEVKAYCTDRNNNVDAERFIDYYTSNGWMVGKNKMKDWKASVRTWERTNTSNSNKKQNVSFLDIAKQGGLL